MLGRRSGSLWGLNQRLWMVVVRHVLLADEGTLAVLVAGNATHAHTHTHTPAVPSDVGQNTSEHSAASFDKNLVRYQVGHR